MKRGFGTLAAALLYLATAFPAFAHHSHPLVYDWCKSITVEGASVAAGCLTRNRILQDTREVNPT